jgi:molybdopterin synthase catalytic subunit
MRNKLAKCLPEREDIRYNFGELNRFLACHQLDSAGAVYVFFGVVRMNTALSV